MQGSLFYRKRGCPRCGNTGYRGRVGVFQLLEMSSRLEQLASEKASRDILDTAAREEGMSTMWEDGIAKVAAGLTSAEELARVCSA
jgi:general secretion pathway protein E